MEAIGPHSFWGFSPSIDLFQIQDEAHKEEQRKPGALEFAASEEDPLVALLGEVGDPRHILRTIAARRSHSYKPIHFYVFENQVESLARHLLLLAIAFDWEIPIRQRANLWLEVFGNTLVQERTSRYISKKRMELIDLVCNGKGPLSRMIDTSTLRFRDRDALEEVLKSWAHTVEFDMVTCRDQRMRHHYAERYDFRRNLIDWDYQMHVRPHAGNIHSLHFRRWRETGIASEFGDETYTTPNRSLASYAKGRERGSTKLVRGFWGDIVLSPYHALGTHAMVPDDPAGADRVKELFAIHSRHTGAEQYRHTEEEISVFNILSYLWEIETGTPYVLQHPHDVYSGLGTSASSLDSAEDLRFLSREEVRETQRAKAVTRARSIAQTLRGVKVAVVAGPLEDWLHRRRFRGLFDMVVLGTRCAHQLKIDEFSALFRPRVTLVAETGRNAVILSQDQKNAYDRQLLSMAGGKGAVWVGTERSLARDQFGLGSYVDPKRTGKPDGVNPPSKTKLSQRAHDALEARIGDHTDGLLFAKDIDSWDLQGGDNPRPEHLVFVWDQRNSRDRKESFGRVLADLERPRAESSGESRPIEDGTDSETSGKPPGTQEHEGDDEETSSPAAGAGSV